MLLFFSHQKTADWQKRDTAAYVYLCLFSCVRRDWPVATNRWDSFNFGTRYPISQGQLKMQTGLDGKVG